MLRRLLDASAALWKEVNYGDGTQTRDFTFIEANVTLLDEAGTDGEAVNIASTDTIESLTLPEEIRDQITPGLELKFAQRHDTATEHTHAGDILARRDRRGFHRRWNISMCWIEVSRRVRVPGLQLRPGSHYW